MKMFNLKTLGTYKYEKTVRGYLLFLYTPNIPFNASFFKVWSQLYKYLV